MYRVIFLGFLVFAGGELPLFSQEVREFRNNSTGLIFNTPSSLPGAEAVIWESGMVRLEPLTLWSSFNTFYPRGEQDGAAWQGRGFNGGAAFGMNLENEWFRFRLAPEVWGASNWDFEIRPSPSKNPFGDYWWGLDRPQRFGDAPLFRFDPGQSDLRFFLGSWTAGFSNESIVLGPGKKNNILMGLQAPGFFHLDLGTRGWWQTGWGDFDLHWIWGQLRESEWFDSNGAGDHKFIHGGTLGYRPWGFPGLSLGFNRYFISPWSTLTPVKGFQWFLDEFFKDDRSWFAMPEGKEDDVDQAVSLTFQWFIPEAGMELWVEWAKNDHPLNFYDFWTDPFISQGFVWGIGKSWPLEGFLGFSKMRVWTEWHDAAENIGVVTRKTSSWYRHTRARGGYTHDGQMLGANAGPGSQSQYVEIAFSGKDLDFSLGVQRLVIDLDYLNHVVKPADVTWFAWRSQVEASLPIALTFKPRWGAVKWEIFPIYHQNFNWNQDAVPFNFSTALEIRFFERKDNG